MCVSVCYPSVLLHTLVCLSVLWVCVLVGEAEKIGDTGNVDTINSPRHVGTVYLMLFPLVWARNSYYLFVCVSVCLKILLSEIICSRF